MATGGGSSDGGTFLLSCVLATLLGGALVFALYHAQRKLRLRRRAGCVPVRVQPGGRLHVLLVQSRKQPDKWIFPAGGVEPGERLEDAAARETREEAGVVGRLGLQVCTVDDGKALTRMYALHVEHELEGWDEDWRARRWFDLGVPGSKATDHTVAEVRRILHPKPQQQRIMDACERLRAELQREGEQCERSWSPPKSTAATKAKTKKG
jgi:8-oxo-dGTP pyrophosphatase MutT (NUDIX family)